MSWVAVTLLAACGARTAPVTTDDDAFAGDAPIDGLFDASEDATDAGRDVATDGGAFVCPTRRPLIGEGCDDDDEGRRCTYGTACRAECVCERGSWVCAADTCEGRCPTRPPATLRCPVSEVDRVCAYPTWCPITCRCDLVADGARWGCISPPC